MAAYVEVKVTVASAFHSEAVKASARTKVPVKAIYARIIHDSPNILQDNERLRREVFELKSRISELEAAASEPEPELSEAPRDVIDIRKPTADYYGNPIRYK